MKDLIKRISALVSQEIIIPMRDSDDYGEMPDHDIHKLIAVF